METTIMAPQSARRAEYELDASGLLGNPYFVDLAEGTMPVEDFRKSQERFYFAVAFFPRALATLAARLPEPRQRLALLRNLLEEHGDFREEAFHQTTFRRFLQSLGSQEPPTNLEAGPAARAFNLTLHGACSLEDWETGAACLGYIEHAFCQVSSFIGEAVVRQWWVRRRDLVHYSVHAALDVRHADDLFALIEPAWSDPARRPAVEAGLKLGAYSFDRLYRDLRS